MNGSISRNVNGLAFPISSHAEILRSMRNIRLGSQIKPLEELIGQPLPDGLTGTVAITSRHGRLFIMTPGLNGSTDFMELSLSVVPYTLPMPLSRRHQQISEYGAD